MRAVLGGTRNDDILAHIDALHQRLKHEYNTRWEIDCFLLALHHDRARPRWWMVLDICDTYHYHNLPDIAFLVRDTLMGLCCAAWLQRLFNIFICGKRYKRLIGTSDTCCQLTAAVINTLHGLLLGLYPFNERRSDLGTRVHIAGQIHTVLVGGRHLQFINDHPQLLCLSLMEYILNAVHDFCPVEWALLSISTGTRSQCLATIEAFREAHVDPKPATWEQLELAATPVVSSLVKFFKDAALYQHKPRPVVTQATAGHLPLALSTRMIHNSSSIFGQLKCALPDIDFAQSEALEQIWTSVYMRQLPAHTTMAQMRALDSLGKMCHLVEKELHHLPLCLTCALTRRSDVMKSLFRHDTITGRLVCNECLNHQAVVHINLLGRILYVRDKAVVLCDRCLRPRHWEARCVCEEEEAAKPEGCCVCAAANVTTHKEIVDIRRFRMKTVHFCYKHTLSCVLNPATVYDVGALERELQFKRPVK